MEDAAMDTISDLKTVSLPDGDVTVSTVPLPWWTEQNGTGFVDPLNIAPDPKNVRRRPSAAKMAELRKSVKTHGVLQPMNMTPLHLAPWVKVEPKYRNCFFLAVGGHRRREAATGEKIGAVPIIVKVYPSEKEHRLDVSLLNKGNEDLTDLEKGYEIVDLQNVGWKVEDLCKEFNYSAPALYVRKHLTMLDPSLQDLLDPELPFKTQLGTILGGEIGSTKEPTPQELDEFYESLADSLRLVPQDQIIPYADLENLDGDARRFAMQRALYAVIKLRNLSSDRAKAFISEHRLKLQATGQHGGAKTQSYQPKRRKDVLGNLVESIMGSLPIDWKPEEWNRIFSLSPREEVEGYRDKLLCAADKLQEWAEILDRLAKTKPSTRPEVQALMDRNRKK